MTTFQGQKVTQARRPGSAVTRAIVVVALLAVSTASTFGTAAAYSTSPSTTTTSSFVPANLPGSSWST